MRNLESEDSEDWGSPDESDQLVIAGYDPENQSKEFDEIIQVDGHVAASWKGVSGCCDQSRVDSEWNAAVARWVDEQKKSHPTLEYWTHGWGQATGECRRWENWPDGRRCNGTLSGPVYVLFSTGDP